jgi:O-antigen/teichoic acid export membrane protein
VLKGAKRRADKLATVGSQRAEQLMASRQGAATGSAYVAGSFLVSGVLTYVFQSLSARFLGKAGYGDLIVLWSATFLVVQVLWIGITQTLGRYISEREARGEDWRPIVHSARRLQISLLAAFLLISLLASPLLARSLFHGSWPLTAAFIAAVVAYAPEYFRRGTFSGHRQFARLGALHVAESSSRALIAALLLLAGTGVLGPTAAIVLAPLIGVLLVRPVSSSPEKVGESFSVVEALRFAGPVLGCVAFAQLLMNGGPILVSILDGTRAQVGLFGAALILTRVPQYVLSPVIGALLPHASRILAMEGSRSFDRFVARAAAIVGLVGVLMVVGTWLLGGWGLKLFAGPGFEVDRGVLVMLAVLAAFYLMSEMLNQALFARGQARLAALGWMAGLPVSAVSLMLLSTDVLERVSYSLALGTLAAAASQAAFYLATRTTSTTTTDLPTDP